MSGDNKRKDDRLWLAESDRHYFKYNPAAGFRVRCWTPEDAHRGTLALDGLKLAKFTMIVFRCGCRLPMVMTPNPSMNWLVAPEAIAQDSIVRWPRLAQDWPQYARTATR